jgi:hypothetical protein
MGAEEGLWSVKLPSGDVRSGTFEELDQAYQAGYIDEAALVRVAYSERWVKVGELLGNGNAPPASGSVAPPATPRVEAMTDLWQVKLASGELRTGTRDQLEEALRAGHIDSRALVLAPGAHEWTPAAALTGSHPAAPGPAPAAQSVTARPPPASPAVAAQSVTARPPPASPAVAAQSVTARLPPAPEASPGTDARADETWQVQMSRAQLEQSLRLGVLAQDALVRTDDAGRWLKLSTALDGGTWQVRLPNGDLRSGTRPQLEEAFHAGHIDASALVLASGAREWVTLGSLVGSGTLRPPPPRAVTSQPPPGPSAAPLTAVAQPSATPRVPLAVPDLQAATATAQWPTMATGLSPEQADPPTDPAPDTGAIGHGAPVASEGAAREAETTPVHGEVPAALPQDADPSDAAPSLDKDGVHTDRSGR